MKVGDIVVIERGRRIRKMKVSRIDTHAVSGTWLPSGEHGGFNPKRYSITVVTS